MFRSLFGSSQMFYGAKTLRFSLNAVLQNVIDIAFRTIYIYIYIGSTPTFSAVYKLYQIKIVGY